MTDAVLVSIGERCAKLEKLVMFTSMSGINIHSVTDAGVRAVLLGCPQLCKIDVEYAGGISIELRVELARRCNFTTLTLGSVVRHESSAGPGFTECESQPGRAKCEWLFLAH
jgi:hypothetical protein